MRCHLRAPVMGKSSFIASCLDDDNGSRNILWNRAVMVASGVTGADRGALADGCHLPSKTRFRSRSTKKPARHTKKPGSVAADITKFAKQVEDNLLFSDMQNVVSKHPPYVEACLKILRGLVASVGVAGPLAAVTGPVSNKYELLLETLVCCMTSFARERLIIELFRKYEGANENEASLWKDAINDATCPPTWRTALSTNAIFNSFIEKKNNSGTPYPKGKIGAFTLLRDVVMHAADCNENPNAPQSGDGIELMIPADKHLNEFLPNIIKNLIEKNVDLNAELSAAIHCACNICDS